MRPSPSAAPVTTPSNRPSTPRMSGTESNAATKCISEVPGLAKHTSTPASTSVRIRDCAPFISLLNGQGRGEGRPLGHRAKLVDHAADRGVGGLHGRQDGNRRPVDELFE